MATLKVVPTSPASPSTRTRVIRRPTSPVRDDNQIGQQVIQQLVTPSQQPISLKTSPVVVPTSPVAIPTSPVKVISLNPKVTTPVIQIQPPKEKQPVLNIKGDIPSTGAKTATISKAPATITVTPVPGEKELTQTQTLTGSKTLRVLSPSSDVKIDTWTTPGTPVAILPSGITPVAAAPSKLKLVSPGTPTKADSTVSKLKVVSPGTPSKSEGVPVETGPKLRVVTGQRKKPTANDYQQKDPRQHIYDVPDTYVGSDDKIARDELLLDYNTGRMTRSTITFPQACERIFLEILSNGGDNADKSRQAGVDPGKMEVTIDRQLVSIKNNGVPIPIEINDQTKKFAPDMIFGVLLTSSNYDKTIQRTGCGRNGYGAKLTNIFSKQFMVMVADSERKLKYTQVWNENMTIRGEPVIEPYHGENFVHIIYQMDFQRFGYTEYPDEALYLFARHSADVSVNQKIQVTFNGIPFNLQDIREYCGRCFGADKNTIVHYEWPAGTETMVKRGSSTPIARDPNILPIIELCIVDTPDAGESISFINGIATKNGGVHVNAAMKSLSTALLDAINGTRSKKTPAAKRGGKKSGKAMAKKAADKPTEKKEIKLTLNDVKPHVSIILICRYPDPKFTSQTKDTLASTNPNPTVEIPDKILNPIMKWDLVERLYMALEAKQFKTLQKMNGRKRRHISLTKGEDANLAGGPQSRNCTLYVVEGKSAMSYAVETLSLVPRGRDFIGVYPMKGKPLNVMNCSRQKIAENDEFKELTTMLGLHIGMDYTNEANFNTLRFGYLVILADSDDDGKHIIGLILNFFYCFYPSLLQRGYCMYLRTPILRVWKGAQRFTFYTQHEYDIWKTECPEFIANPKGWKHKYFKGLGTSTNANIKEDFKSPRVVVCLYDDQAPAAFRLAFDEKLADERKQWIATWKKLFEVEALEHQPISDFINYEFIQFSRTNLHRSIPRLMDGLKESQRKILWAALLRWSTQGKPELGLKRAPAEFKVAQLAAYVASETNYHHGEKCLIDTIVSMAQDYVGANNMPYFTQDGQFGTRNMGGEDAADARYSHTRPEWWLKLMFRKEDIPLLQMVVDDGKAVEPVTFLPILPLASINGISGIGTGHSTFVPCHNPLDCCEWIEAKIRGRPLPDVLPWYRGFKGTINLVVRGRKIQDVVTAMAPGSTEVSTEQITISNGQIKVSSTAEVESPIITLSTRPTSPIGRKVAPGLMSPRPVISDGKIRLVVSPQASPTGDTPEGESGYVDLDEVEVDDALPDTLLKPTPDEEQVIAGITGTVPKNAKISMVTLGNFTVKPNSVLVDELPIGRWTHHYDKWLEDLVEEKEITDKTNLSTATDVNFEVFGMATPTHQSLRLQKSYGMSNMVLLSIDNTPVKYPTTLSILEAFFAERFPYYEARRQYFIQKITEDITKLQLKMRFIQAVNNGQLVVMKRKKRDVLPEMRALGLPDELLTNTRASNFTDEEIDEINAQILTSESNRQIYLNTSAGAMWLSDIDEFKQAYCRHYKLPIPGSKVGNGPGLRLVPVAEEEEDSAAEEEEEEETKKTTTRRKRV